MEERTLAEKDYQYNLHPQEETKSNLRGKRKMKSAES